MNRRVWFKRMAGGAAAVAVQPAALSVPWRTLAAWAAREGVAGRLNFHQWNYGVGLLLKCGALPKPQDVGLGDGMARLTLGQYRSVMAGVLR
jgi:hypothetical protein